jgi:selenium metabolism protein YedF
MIVDAKGKPCPTPVIMTKKALESIEEGVITVLVDSFTSKENVLKYAAIQGLTADVTEKNGVYEISIAKGYPCSLPAEAAVEKVSKIVLYVGSNAIGNGDCYLGEKLMDGFIANIKNMDIMPSSIIFVNSGVYLTTLNATTIEELKKLEGVEILSCGTCLEHFELVDKLKVGEITDGYNVMKRLFEADKVIRL